MGKKSKAAAEAAATGRRAKRKRGFLRRSLGKLAFVGAVSAAARYFGDSAEGDARRQKVRGIVGK